MIDRRRLLTTAAAGAAVLAAPVSLRAAGTPLRIAAVKFGSLSWVLDTIRALGLDRKADLTLHVIEVASNQAGPVALLAGGADVIVSDWTWAMRQRALGEKLKFSAYSSALGSLVVAQDSEIDNIAELEGKRLGVAGSAIDKSWLLLRAYARRTIGQDLATFAQPTFGAAPLLAEQMRAGRIDAVLNYWTYAARLTGAGFKEILRVDELMQDLNIDPMPALVGFVWKESYEAAHGKDLMALLDVVREANEVLNKDDAVWERLRPLVKPETDSEFKSIIAAYREGIPKTWGTSEVESAKKLMDILVSAGDAELMGRGTEFDAKLFHHAAS